MYGGYVGQVITRAILEGESPLSHPLPCWVPQTPLLEILAMGQRCIKHCDSYGLDSEGDISDASKNCQCLTVKLSDGQQSSIKKFTGADGTSMV